MEGSWQDHDRIELKIFKSFGNMSVKNFSGFVTLSQHQTLLPKRLWNGQSTIQSTLCCICIKGLLRSDVCVLAQFQFSVLWIKERKFQKLQSNQELLGWLKISNRGFFVEWSKDFLLKTKWEKIFSRTFVTRYRVSESLKLSAKWVLAASALFSFIFILAYCVYFLMVDRL